MPKGVVVMVDQIVPLPSRADGVVHTVISLVHGPAAGFDAVVVRVGFRVQHARLIHSVSGQTNDTYRDVDRDGTVVTTGFVDGALDVVVPPPLLVSDDGAGKSKITIPHTLLGDDTETAFLVLVGR